ncbi:MAG: tetratricopeptide repeat protein [Alphaproteobacteria bacterium]|nr:tetratricopeptide repeat protein [Alphaproteobacteria bacterium]
MIERPNACTGGSSILTRNIASRLLRFAKGLRHHIALAVLGFRLAGADPALAEDADAAEQQHLYDLMAEHPTDYRLALEFVGIATKRGDYEAAIGALERLLYYNPDLPLLKYELGALYYRLGVYDVATRYLTQALASPELDAAAKARAEAYLADAVRQRQQSRLSGFLQTGLRYQSNASLEPASGTVRVNGQDFGLAPASGGKSDVNWFALVSLGHDYDLQNEDDDVLETRFVGYLTRQFHSQNLDSALVEASFGPRLPLAPQLLPGTTVKPYIVGGNAWVRDAQYLSSLGTGLALGIPSPWGAMLEPSFEWRRERFTTGDPAFSEFDSGDWFTTALSSTLALSERAAIDIRSYYRRGEAALRFQSFDQWGAEASLSFQFAPPFAAIPRSWGLSPFARVVRTSFDAPNPSIDAATAHTDTEWIAGLFLDAPLTAIFGAAASIQYDHAFSTLPNFRQNNLSITFGPTARF